MKFSAIFATLAVLAVSSVNGKFGFGGCPTMTSIPWNAGMADLGTFHLHFIDKLINNVFTVVNLVALKQYKELNCLKYTVDMNIDEKFYNQIVSEYLNGARLPFSGAITYFEPNTDSFLVTGCIDAETFSRGMAGVLVGSDIPDIAKTALSIAAFVFKFAHFQLTLGISEATTLTNTLATAYDNAIGALPGKMKKAYLTQIKQTQADCPSYWSPM